MTYEFRMGLSPHAKRARDERAAGERCLLELHGHRCDGDVVDGLCPKHTARLDGVVQRATDRRRRLDPSASERLARAQRAAERAAAELEAYEEQRLRRQRERANARWARIKAENGGRIPYTEAQQAARREAKRRQRERARGNASPDVAVRERRPAPVQVKRDADNARSRERRGERRHYVTRERTIPCPMPGCAQTITYTQKRPHACIDCIERAQHAAREAAKVTRRAA